MCLLLIIAVCFVLLGLHNVIYPHHWQDSISNSPIWIRWIGVVCTFFFGVTAAYGAVKLFDKKVGLRIDEAGITDNSSITSVGLIEWGDITGITESELSGTKFLVIKTNNPSKYIDRARTRMFKQGNKSNHRRLGSPIVINSVSLSINYSELKAILIKQLLERNVISRKHKIFRNKADIVNVKTIGRNFRIWASVVMVFMLIHLMAVFVLGDTLWINRTGDILTGVSALWILLYYEMLQVNTYYLRCLALAIGIGVVGLIVKYVHPDVSILTTAWSMSSLVILLLQGPMRRIYISWLNREPKVDTMGTFTDLFYTVILSFGGMLIPIIFVEWIR